MSVSVSDGMGSPPPVLSDPDDGYQCDCPGFKQNTVERMCVRCLAAYAEALPFVLNGTRLDREMTRVAISLKRIISHEIGAIRSMTVNAALMAAEGSQP